MTNNGKIVVAMSGGVDSSVAAALLKERGHEVIGVSLQLWNYNSETDSRFGTCCSLDDLADARRVADRIGIPFYILNMEKEFQTEVVDRFVAEYLQGRTPIPCTLCNQRLKFDHLLARTRALGFDTVATGHYARIAVDSDGTRCVQRGLDIAKDQSYFLWGLSQEQLARLMFPLGELSKPEVRRLARELGLNVAEKDESQEICFIPDNDYRNFIAQRTNGTGTQPGPIIDSAGQTLGTHSGYTGYTVGQRKGLNIGGLTEPYFVSRIDTATNTVTAGPRQELLCAEFIAERVNWRRKPDGPVRADVQIRHRHRAAPAEIRPLPGDAAEIRFIEPQSAVAPGQAAVFFQDDGILGGGWIR
jgi:tRNA-specific 2-thiouridylase